MPTRRGLIRTMRSRNVRRTVSTLQSNMVAAFATDTNWLRPTISSVSINFLLLRYAMGGTQHHAADQCTNRVMKATRARGVIHRVHEIVNKLVLLKLRECGYGENVLTCSAQRSNAARFSGS